MKQKIAKYIPLFATVIGALVSIMIGRSNIDPESREILIKARQYAYEPPLIQVNRGDTLHITLRSLDVVHGFYVEGYDTDAKIFANQKKFKYRRPSEGEKWEEVDKLTIITDKTGKFRYRCSHTCGTMHPFMQGELVVHPNTPYHAGIGACFGLAVGMLGMFLIRSKKSS
jgi:heme/copper-type cytochrome/quinol oxidase subunit 2